MLPNHLIAWVQILIMWASVASVVWVELGVPNYKGDQTEETEITSATPRAYKAVGSYLVMYMP